MFNFRCQCRLLGDSGGRTPARNPRHPGSALGPRHPQLHPPGDQIRVQVGCSIGSLASGFLSPMIAPSSSSWWILDVYLYPTSTSASLSAFSQPWTSSRQLSDPEERRLTNPRQSRFKQPSCIRVKRRRLWWSSGYARPAGVLFGCNVNLTDGFPSYYSYKSQYFDEFNALASGRIIIAIMVWKTPFPTHSRPTGNF